MRTKRRRRARAASCTRPRECVKALPLVLSSSSPWRPACTARNPSRPSSTVATAWSSAELVKTLPIRRSNRSSRPLHAHGLHHRVGGQQPVAEVAEEALERVAVVAERLAQDVVLHRVGGDDGGVVALGVGRSEVVAEHLDVDLAGEHVVAREPVHRHPQLAVGDLHGRSSSRSRAILAISPSATSISCSGSCSSRSAAVRRIESLVCSRAQTTNGKPKRSR